MIVFDDAGSIGLANAQTEKLFSYSRAELAGRSIEWLLPDYMQSLGVHPLDGDSPRGYLPPAKVELELDGRRKDGRLFPAEISINPLATDEGRLATCTIRDISYRTRLEARYRHLVEGIPAVTFIASLDSVSNELYVSPQIEQLLGFSQREWLEDPILWYTRLHPEDRERWHKEFAQTCASAAPFRSVYRFVARDGRIIWVQGEAKLVRDAAGRPLFLQGVAFDITERKAAEEALRRSHIELEALVQVRTVELANTNRDLAAALEEKESLLKEIHHRVKNNLQVICSLLNLQSATIKDPATLHAIRESQNRVKSMALIHEKLYQSRDLGRIDFGQYTRELVAHLIRSYGVVRSNLNVRIEMDDAKLCSIRRFRAG